MNTARQLRIALVSGDFTADGRAGLGGGIETYVRAMAKGLAGGGHDVHVITRALHHSHTSLAHGARLHGIYVPDEWQPGAGDLGEARDALAFAWHAWRQVRALAASGGRFDIVEAPEYKAQGFYMARDGGLPLVVKCHAHLALCLDLNGVALADDTALVADLERETLGRATAVHANSLALAARCSVDYQVPAARFVHVPYGIDTGLFQPTASTWRESWGVGAGPVALFVGRMEPRKGIETLVPAFTELVRRMPDATLVVAGPDTVGVTGRTSQQQWMSDTWAAAGVAADRVRQLGPVSPGDLPALYSAADVMVAPSPYEAFGLVYLEAMACGTAAIGCAAGGVPEIITDGITGRLVPPGDAPALASAMEQLLADAALRRRLSAAGRAAVERDYSLSAVVRRTAAFYQDVASRHQETGA